MDCVDMAYTVMAPVPLLAISTEGHNYIVMVYIVARAQYLCMSRAHMPPGPQLHTYGLYSYSLQPAIRPAPMPSQRRKHVEESPGIAALAAPQRWQQVCCNKASWPSGIRVWSKPDCVVCARQAP